MLVIIYKIDSSKIIRVCIHLPVDSGGLRYSGSIYGDKIVFEEIVDYVLISVLKQNRIVAQLWADDIEINADDFEGGK